jgi:hypothetical protein
MPNDVILVHVPESLVEFTDTLADFFESMLMKLDKNSHKKTPTTKDIPEIIDNLREEVIEFEEQLALNKFDENTLIELADTANFAFLAYVALRLQGVNHDSKSTISLRDRLPRS